MKESLTYTCACPCKCEVVVPFEGAGCLSCGLGYHRGAFKLGTNKN